jgi:hypothetical protein
VGGFLFGETFNFFLGIVMRVILASFCITTPAAATIVWSDASRRHANRMIPGAVDYNGFGHFVDPLDLEEMELEKNKFRAEQARRDEAVKQEQLAAERVASVAESARMQEQRRIQALRQKQLEAERVALQERYARARLAEISLQEKIAQAKAAEEERVLQDRNAESGKAPRGGRRARKHDKASTEDQSAHKAKLIEDRQAKKREEAMAAKANADRKEFMAAKERVKQRELQELLVTDISPSRGEDTREEDGWETVPRKSSARRSAAATTFLYGQEASEARRPTFLRRSQSNLQSLSEA